jgi:ADP-ribose pyrophosphatase
MEEKVVKLGRKEIYNGKRVHLVTEKLRFPDGKEAEWELILHPGAAAVIPVDDEGKIIMVRQYRNAPDAYTLEIPAGTLDHQDEAPIECGKRELQEETGYYSDDFEFLFKFYSAIGICNEMIHIYVAKNLQVGQQNLDEDEFVTLERYTIDELIQMIVDGEITDNKTISSLLLYKEKYINN